MRDRALRLPQDRGVGMNHSALVTCTAKVHMAFLCCPETRPVFQENWNSSDSVVRTWVFGDTMEVFARILAHITHGRSDPHTAEMSAAARNQSALTNSTEAGIRLLAEQLPYLSVLFADAD